MNRKGIFVLVWIVLLCSGAEKIGAAYGINRTINFQGKLVDSNGVNVPNSTPVTVAFSLYETNSSCPGGGTAVWSENQTFTPVDGIFQVALGSQTAFGTSINFSQDTLYLGIQISGEANEMCSGSSRIKLAAVPYAFNAESFAGLTADDSQSNYFTITGGQGTPATLTVNGNITIGPVISPTSAGGLTLQSNGANVLVLDTGGGAALNIGTTNSNAITLGRSATGDSGGSLVKLPGGLVASGKVTGKALVILDETGDQNILAASAGGATKFVVDRNGGVTMAGGLNVAGQTVFGSRVNTQTLTSSQSVTESTAANVFFLSNDIGTGGGLDVTITFNLTGVSNTDGTVLFLAVQAIKQASGTDSTSSVNVTINGGSNIFTSSVTTGLTQSATVVIKNVILTRINGVWRNVAAEVTSDQAADLAEYYYTFDDSISPGQLVSLDRMAGEATIVRKSSGAYDEDVLGIVSTNPGLVLGSRDGPGRGIPIALSGRVPVKVTGPVGKGDPLTASDTPGVAMKATKTGPMVGIAMENYAGNEVGSILAFVNLSTAVSSIQAVSGTPADELIQANKIEGLEVLSEKFSVLENQVASLSGGLTVVTPTITPPSSIDLNVLGDLIANGSLLAKGPATFSDEVVFKKNTVFESWPIFGKDTAGSAVIGRGNDRVNIIFDKEYLVGPIVSVSMTFNDLGEEANDQLEKKILGENYTYAVTRKTTKGFTIVLNKLAQEDITFSWMALAVKEPKTFSNILNQLDLVVPSPTPTGEIIPTAIILPTPTEVATDSANLMPP